MGRDAKSEDHPTLWDQPDQHGPAGQRSLRPPPLPARRPINPMDHHELWTIDDVANYLGVPKQTIYAWRTSGYGPQGFRVGKHVRWRSSTVITWTLGLEQER
jgi:excisionase family DNA binding protein